MNPPICFHHSEKDVVSLLFSLSLSSKINFPAYIVEIYIKALLFSRVKDRQKGIPLFNAFYLIFLAQLSEINRLRDNGVRINIF